MRILIIWLLLSFAAAVIAHGKGRSARVFFVLSLLLSPLIGLPAALLIAPDPAALERRNALRRCPHCGTRMPVADARCRKCGRDLPEIIDVEGKVG